MFIGDQYPYVRSWGASPPASRLSFIKSLSNSRIGPAAGAGTWSAVGVHGRPSPGGGLRGPEEQFSARLRIVTTLTRAWSFCLLSPPLWSSVLYPPLTGPCFRLTLPWLPYSIPLTRVQCELRVFYIPGLYSPCAFPPPYPSPLIFISSSST